MAGPFGRGREGSISFQNGCRHQRGKKRVKRGVRTQRRKTTNKEKKCTLNQKLEQENYNKGLSLDPQKNHHHQNQFLQIQIQNQNLDTHQNQNQNRAAPQLAQKKRCYFQSTEEEEEEREIEHARLGQRMGDQNHQRMRMGVRHNGGEIVEVEGGHIVRSIGRKDRHSKVCTAKGPRDRRVRLAAHTAIQFYDVQDRLGYDRPSKAVDWLIKKAKSAIDELAELPAWNPTSNWSSSNPNFEQNNNLPPPQPQMGMASEIGCSSQQMEIIGNDGFLPTSLDSDAIADTIKSFFPMGGTINNDDKFHNFDSSSSEMVLRNQSQDLRLSLQSFQDPILLHQQQQENEAEQGLFSGTTALGFDSSWSDHSQTGEINRFQRMIAWNGDSGGGGGGFVFNSQPQPGTTPFLQPLFGETNQFGNQRGPLQSSNNNNNTTTQLNRAWIDPTSISDHHAVPFYYQSSLQGIGFSGYHIPAWIQGEEEEHDGVSDKPSSASSDSRH